MNKWNKWAAILLIIAALLISVYPMINFINTKQYQYTYIEQSQNIDNKEQQLVNAVEYNRLLINDYQINNIHMGGKDETNNDIIISNLDPQFLDYKEQLNEVITILEIPSLGIKTPVFHGTDEATLVIGAGHVDYTALPIGGLNSRCVIAGHSGMRNSEMFDNIRKLKIGDKILFHTLGDIYCYSVCQIDDMIEPEKLEELIQPIEGKDLISLFTCTPYGINSHRLIITAERVPFIQNDNSLQFRDNNNYLYLIILIVIIIFLIWKTR